MFNLKSFETVAEEFNLIFSSNHFTDETVNEIARYKAIVNRSIENIDSLLGLMDTENEGSIKAIDAYAKIISDHINFRYNASTPQSPMLDYELNLILAYTHKIMKLLISLGESDKLSDELNKNYTSYLDIIKTQREEFRKQEESFIEEQKRKQKEWDDAQDELDRKELPQEDSSLVEKVEEL